MDLNQLKSINQKLSQINESKVEELLKQEILSNAKEIVAKVRARWKEGKRPDGKIIGTYRSFAYEMEKRQRNPLAGGTVDLIDTGSLNQKLVVNYRGNGLFTIFSDDKKAVDIAKKYGLDVYGLTDEEMSEVLYEASKGIYFKLIKFTGI